jgi:sulfate adenylyltransferase
MIDPLGGILVERRLDQAQVDAGGLHSLRLDGAALADLELISNGGYSPLAGFMTRDDYRSVVQHASLASGTPWTLPITLPVPAAEAAKLREGMLVALRDAEGELRGTLEVHEIFERDVELEASEVYRTTDPEHPGVRALLSAGELLAGGIVSAVANHRAEAALTPAQTRDEFARRGWSTVVAFQTRNPVHRAHEYLTKVALEQVDGLLLHPLSGATKDDDVPFEVRMQCYRVLLERYYVPDRVVLALFPAAMRYAGPREAVYHGLVRRNYGCSHFIIGRDAAGVGSYYGPYDAQHLYDELGGAERLGFTALKFEHAFYCRACEGMASTRTCPHGPADRVALSGTRLREMLAGGEEIPAEFSRPEVAAILRAAYAGSRGETGS